MPTLIRFLVCGLLAASLSAQMKPGNKPERLEWFRDLGFGMFIHWNVDVPLGSVISHNLVGAAPDYVNRYFNELPKLMNPKRFEPEEWAKLAKLAGMKYVVFTTKHHAGFCWWPTLTTPFNIMNTPFRRDVTGEIVSAFRDQGIAVGFYISPDDFWWFHQNGYPIARPPAPNTTTKEIPALMEYGKRQVRELLSNYGKIDIFFIDGPADGLREQAWEMQPEIVVTRGAIETPEQHVPGIPMDIAWEGNMTIGSAWQHKPFGEGKSGPTLVETLIEVRAKGGNFLLNIGPKANGEMAIEEEERLREVALWNFVNGESIEATRPWIITNEGNVWFTRHKTDKTVYAFVTRSPWKLGERREIVLKSVRATAGTRIGILGQTGEILEYRPDVDPRTTWKQEASGLRISAMTAQRMYDDRQWHLPVVLKITEAEPALKPPRVSTRAAQWKGGWILEGDLESLGDAASVKVGFQYRPRKGLTDLYEKTEPWRNLPLAARSTSGKFQAPLPGVTRSQDYEFRAMVQHPLLTMYGTEKALENREVKLH